MPPAEFNAIEAVYHRMDRLARDVAATPRGDPRRLEIIEDMTRLSILADSVKKKSADIYQPPSLSWRISSIVATTRGRVVKRRASDCQMFVAL